MKSFGCVSQSATGSGLWSDRLNRLASRMSPTWLENHEFSLDDHGLLPLSPAEIEAIRRGESSMSDVEAAEALTDSVSGLMVSVATGRPSIKTINNDYKREHRALAAILGRIGIGYPNRFSDLWRWHGKWSDGTLPTYASRRTFIADLFEPVHAALTSQARRHTERCRTCRCRRGRSTPVRSAY
jgi:hypothetical protein